MSISRKIFLVVGSMVTTVLIILCLTHIPMAYPHSFRAMLDGSANSCLYESFDARLERELDALQYQQLRPMLHQLALLQIARKAQQARLQTISKMDRSHWGTPIRSTRTEPVGVGGPGLSTAMHQPQPAVTQRPACSGDLPIMLFFVALASIWLLARRPSGNR